MITEERLKQLLDLWSAAQVDYADIRAKFEAEYGFDPTDIDSVEGIELKDIAEDWLSFRPGHHAATAFEAVEQDMPDAERIYLSVMAGFDHVVDLGLALTAIGYEAPREVLDEAERTVDRWRMEGLR